MMMMYVSSKMLTRTKLSSVIKFECSRIFSTASAPVTCSEKSLDSQFLKWYSTENPKQCNPILNQWTRTPSSCKNYHQEHEHEVSNLTFQQISETTENLSTFLRTIEGRRRKVLIEDENSEISKLISALREELVIRLRMTKVPPNKFISLSNENFLNILKYCEHWLYLENRKTKNSFVFWVVNDIGDSESGRSMQRFKHFTVEGFVTFCNLMRHVSLGEGFHKYYILIKFLDLFDQMSSSDISDVCSTLVHHSLHLGTDHPVNQVLKQKLVNHLHHHLENLESRSIMKICSALNPQLEYNFLPELVDNIQDIQRRAVKIIDKIDVKALIALMNVTNNNFLMERTGVDKDFVDAVVEKLCQTDSSQLFSKELCVISFTISKQRDTPRGRYYLTKCVPKLINHLQEQPRNNAKNVLMISLHMAHLGLYDHCLLDTLFSCPEITFLCRDGRRTISNQLLYTGGYNRQAGMDKAAGDVMMLQGMVDLEQSGYRGQRVDKDFDKHLNMAVGDTPLEIKKKEDTRLLNGYFNRIHLEVYNNLVRLTGGEDKVWETFVLPCSSAVGYVVARHQGHFLKIDSSWRSEDRSAVKNFSGCEGLDWLVFHTYHPVLRQRWVTRCGGQPVMERLLRRLNIRPVLINCEEWENISDDDCKLSYMTQKLKDLDK